MSAQMRTILDALKTALGTITTGNGYNTTVALVKEDYVIANKDLPDKPALAFYCDNRMRVNSAFGRSKSTLHILIWGLVLVQEEDFDNADNLEADVEKCLNAWTYEEFTRVMACRHYSGGVNEMEGLFEMEVEVDYFHNEGAP